MCIRDSTCTHTHTSGINAFCCPREKLLDLGVLEPGACLLDRRGKLDQAPRGFQEQLAFTTE
eukprot:2221962-Alexandrium_andersonii.AAC.1